MNWKTILLGEHLRILLSVQDEHTLKLTLTGVLKEKKRRCSSLASSATILPQGKQSPFPSMF